MRFLHIMHHLQEQAQSPVPDLAAIAAQLGPEAATAQQFLLNSVVEAVLQSFASRLRDSSSLIRRAARYVSSGTNNMLVCSLCILHGRHLCNGVFEDRQKANYFIQPCLKYK